MAVEVEILSSNVEVLAKQPSLELLPFLDFLEITQYRGPERLRGICIDKK
ncbi:hypothetical protein [Enterococcus faecalis]